MPISAPSFPPLLQVAGLSAGYGKIGVLNGIDLKVGQGEIVALLGPNGAGKSTLLKAVSGLLPRTGTVTFGGQDISRAGPGDTVRLGLVHVVEGHRVFTQQTVHDNLLLAGYGMARGELELARRQHSVGDQVVVLGLGDLRLLPLLEGDRQRLREFLHAFLRFERLQSHLPVQVQQGTMRARASTLATVSALML